jgi:predicted lactoylglutathione lyase
VITFTQLNLVVSDMAATLRFYRLLGLKIPAKAIWKTKSGIHHVSAQMGNVHLDFDSKAHARKFNKGYRKNSGGGNVIIGFAMDTRAAVDKTFNRMVRAGYRGLQEPWDSHWGARFAVIADPDSNHVGIQSRADPKKRSAAPAL